MKVKCISNTLGEIQPNFLRERLKEGLHLDDDESVGLEKGKEYVVYGILHEDRGLSYYVCADDDDEYPIPLAAEFFTVIDGRLSIYWRPVYRPEKEARSYFYSAFLMEPWAEDASFYENLVEGAENELSVFQKYKKLIADEF